MPYPLLRLGLGLVGLGLVGSAISQRTTGLTLAERLGLSELPIAERLRERFGEGEELRKESEREVLERRIKEHRGLSEAAKNDLLKELNVGNIKKVKETLSSADEAYERAKLYLKSQRLSRGL